jgi:hypothetical protein
MCINYTTDLVILMLISVFERLQSINIRLIETFSLQYKIPLVTTQYTEEYGDKEFQKKCFNVMFSQGSKQQSYTSSVHL